MIKEFLMRKMMEKQLANVPKEEQDKIIKAVSENPQLFTDIAQKIKAKTDAGQDQMKAAMEVMSEYQAELSKILGPKG